MDVAPTKPHSLNSRRVGHKEVDCLIGSIF